MKPKEFAARLAAIPEEEPDEIDLTMLEAAKAVNDGTVISLETFNILCFDTGALPDCFRTHTATTERRKENEF
ncbi:MAG: hypothetical protein IJT94_10315 [Oscillibacter sp.]|nr:hypothetical protein [Oscillibacter sp.]